MFPGYRNSWYSKEKILGFELIRVKTFIAPNSGLFKRMLDFISFMIMSAIVSVLLKKHDVVVATSPQFFQQYLDGLSLRSGIVSLSLRFVTFGLLQ